MEPVMSVMGGKDAMEPGFAASEIDTSKPHPARMYDATLAVRTTIPLTGKPSGRSCVPFPRSAP